MPRDMKADLDARAAKLRLTRTDYLRLLILADLDKGDAPLQITLPASHQPAPDDALQESVQPPLEVKVAKKKKAPSKRPEAKH
jgi:hypothetical protein